MRKYSWIQSNFPFLKRATMQIGMLTIVPGPGRFEDARASIRAIASVGRQLRWLAAGFDRSRAGVIEETQNTPLPKPVSLAEKDHCPSKVWDVENRPLHLGHAGAAVTVGQRNGPAVLPPHRRVMRARAPRKPCLSFRTRSCGRRSVDLGQSRLSALHGWAHLAA
jgi:hypothetical protein